MMRKVWQNISFKSKIAVLIFIMLGFVAATGISYHALIGEVRDMGIEQTTKMMLKGYKNELKDIVDVMALTLSSAVEGVTDEKEIYRIFSKLIKNDRFLPDESGYYFIYKKGGIVFAHAAQPHLEGKDLIDFKDPNGKLLIKELDDVSRSGGGYVDYMWEKPGQGVKPKLSYARMIPGTYYWIGTGVYIDDIQSKEAVIYNTIHKHTMNFIKKFYFFLGVALLVVVGPLSWLLVRSIVHPILELIKVTNEYSLGNLDLSILATERKDEIGKLAAAIQRLGISIQLALERLTKRSNSSKRFDTRMEPVNNSSAIRGVLAGMELEKSNRSVIKTNNGKKTVELAKVTIRLFEHLKLSADDQLVLLGLTDANPEILTEIREGKLVPNPQEFQDRIMMFMKIFKALQTIYPNNKNNSFSWINNRNELLGNRTPLEVIRDDGMAGLIRVAESIGGVSVN